MKFALVPGQVDTDSLWCIIREVWMELRVANNTGIVLPATTAI